MVVGSGYSDVFWRDFYSAIHAAYYGPKIQSMELLPDVVRTITLLQILRL